MPSVGVRVERTVRLGREVEWRLSSRGLYFDVHLIQFLSLQEALPGSGLVADLRTNQRALLLGCAMRNQRPAIDSDVSTPLLTNCLRIQTPPRSSRR